MLFNVNSISQAESFENVYGKKEIYDRAKWHVRLTAHSVKKCLSKDHKIVGLQRLLISL